MTANYDNIPSELKQLKQWVCWSGDKLPKNARTGGNAQSNNPETWCDFDTAVQAVEKYHFNGIGFMLSSPYFGVDLDDCFDDQDFVDEFVEGLRSYTEISQSGRGIHILCKGTLPDGANRRGKVEMYSNRRYFIMTGNRYTDYTEIRDCTDEIKILHQKYLYVPQPESMPRKFERITLADEDVIDKARNCLSGSMFQLLYQGQWQGLPYQSQSEADLAFCSHLAFWTQKDTMQIDRIFRSSGLYRSKWDEKRGSLTYGQITISKAISSCDNVYEPKVDQDDTQLAVRFFGGKTVGRVGEVKTYDMTDTGNAQRMYDEYGGIIHYIYSRRKWMYWTGSVWQIDETGEIKKLADMIVNKLKDDAMYEQDEKTRERKLKFAARTANTNGKNAMITETQHLDGIPILQDDLDYCSDLLNCKNGIVDLSNGELTPHDSQKLMSKICLCDYEVDASKKPERWLQFIDEVTNGDKELARYLQKCVGYSLSGSIKEQCAFFLYGLGNNGKSTFLDTISEVLGTYAMNTQPEVLMMKKYGDNGAGTQIARLKSARMVTAEEPTEGVRLNEGLIKQLTGGGKLTCRFLYGDEFEYTPEFKLWIATNHKPVIQGTDFGIWRRIRLIPFETTIPADKVDKQLKHKLLGEMPGILHWAVEGAIMYHNEGLEPPQCVVESTAEYKAEMDLIATFMDACISIDYTSAERIPANEIYIIYTNWARENNEYVMTSRRFFGEFKKKVPKSKRISSGIVYENIVLTGYAQRYIQQRYTPDMFYSD